MIPEVSIDPGKAMQLGFVIAVYVTSGDARYLQKGGAYATVARTVKASAGTDGNFTPSRLELGPYEPVTMEFVRALGEGLGISLPPEVLPAHVICRTQDRIVWWSPPGIRTMFFSRQPLAALDGEDLPVPGLVWRMDLNRERTLYLRALRSGDRPDAGTELYLPPFLNVESNGRVCQGSMRRPRGVDLDRLGDWEAGFFGAAFGGQLFQKITTYRGDLAKLWPRQRGERKFPVKFLRESGQTLNDFVTKERL